VTKVWAGCVLVVVIFVGTNTVAESRYERWLDQEVKWIIGKDEKKRFEALTSDEERDQFIEQFWQERDPSAGTPQNQYKEEHYLRLKYANEHLSEGTGPGWRTDRGRIYIIHGAPVSRRLEQDFEYWGYSGNPYASYYKGPLTLVFERGGSTFQQRALSESRQGQAQLEIYERGARNTDVMTSASSRFRLVRAGPGLGTGGAILTSSGETDRYIGEMLRSPGDLLDEQRRDEERRREAWRLLTADVSAEVTYGDLYCRLETSLFYRGRESLVFFEVEIDPLQLSFEKQGKNSESAKLDAFCEILDAADQYQVDLLDETVILSRDSKASDYKEKLFAFSDRFRIPSGDHELRCLVQDVTSRKVGEARVQVSIPSPELGKVAMSSLLLTQLVGESGLADFEHDESLLFQNLKFSAVPIDRVIQSQPVFLFFEVYQEAASTSSKRFVFDYRLYDQEQVFLKVPLQELQWKQTDNRFSQALQFDLAKLPAGEYTFLVKVIDTVSRAHSMKTASFRIRESVED
jgi:GWxTD domain-containing protein